MNLKLIGDTVSSIAKAIANVLDVDVIVVDRDLLIIGNTYKYMLENDINVTIDSVIATSIIEGEKKVIIDISNHYNCKICKDSARCKIGGIIAIPIKYEEEIIGSIGIMLSGTRVKNWFSENLDGITVFLESMAGLLGSKLASVNQVNKIEIINTEIEHIITNVKDGIVYLDSNNNIAYYNNVFSEYFNIKDNIKGIKIEKILNHAIINNYIYSKKNISDEVFVYQNSKVNFKGLISCVNTNLNSKYLGTVITFRKIEETYRVMNEMLNNKSSEKFSKLICEDVDILREVERAKKVAIKNSNIIIEGKSGTGKRTLAHCIHNFSDRKSNYIITINCKYLPREYYLSELFGIGESMINSGKFQLADRGTIVFNEITNLPLNIQLDLLSYIITGEIKMEKGIIIKNIDVRIIATTEVDIRKKIKEGYFSEELFYRLNINNFKLKELTQRDRVDFNQFIKNFLEKYSKIFSKETIKIEKEGIDLLFNTHWEENITGVEKFLEQMVYHTNKRNYTKQNIMEELERINGCIDSLIKIKSFDEYEKEIIKNALSHYDGVKNKIDIVADKLDIGRATLYRKINKYGLM